MRNDESGVPLLTTTYFGPIDWYSQLYRADRVRLEACESFIKQTYRNRCVIATANGLQTLTVPVEHASKYSPLTPHPLPSTIRDVRISNHGSWRRVHWNALQSAYSESPFFEYYADDLHPFFERDYKFLYDLNFDIIQKVCELLDIHPTLEHTTAFMGVQNPPSSTFHLPPYWQVFACKYGFRPNLSILDLLFCMGPEGIFYL